MKFEKPKCTAVIFSERLPCMKFKKPKCMAVRLGLKNIFLVQI